VVVIFTYFFLPETKDRTLEEIHHMFEAKVPARKFKGYVVAEVEDMAAEAAGKGGIRRDEKTGAIHVESSGEQ
jgi:hypothetical protein